MALTVGTLMFHAVVVIVVVVEHDNDKGSKQKAANCSL